jgi:CHASE2 domain-containing sensor protein
VASTGLLAPLTNWLCDLRFAAAPRPATGRIVLVEIDARSLQAFGQLPGQRRVHGDLIRILHDMDAAEVALDVDLSTASTESDDAALELALREVGGRTILATRRLTGTRQDGAAALGAAPLTRFSAHAQPALVNVRPDPDRLVRSVPFGAMLGQTPAPSLAALLAGAEWADRSFRVDWSIDPGSFDRISAIDLLKHRIDPARIAGKSVIIGDTAAHRDFFQVPAHGVAPSALVRAVAAETLLQGRALATTGLPLTAFGAELLAVLLITLQGRLRLRAALIGLGLLSATIEALAILVQVRTAIVVDTAAWQFLLAGGAVAAVAARLDLRRVWLEFMANSGESTELVA